MPYTSLPHCPPPMRESSFTCSEYQHRWAEPTKLNKHSLMNTPLVTKREWYKEPLSKIFTFAGVIYLANCDSEKSFCSIIKTRKQSFEYMKGTWNVAVYKNKRYSVQEIFSSISFEPNMVHVAIMLYYHWNHVQCVSHWLSAVAS